jgi:bifunctional UDP-N-acetylglucosamine pyrophosphorylase/glucosamine-1-phosphate N-acetyltransferase
MANLAGIILAAGQGTRMKSARPKVMHEVAGRPMLGHVMAAMRAAGIERIVVVTAADAEEVRTYASREGGESVVQERQLGTGHAAACAGSLLNDFPGPLVVTYGDMPLVTPDLFVTSFQVQEDSGMSIVAFESDSQAYGRVVFESGSRILDRIVEYKDANEDERRIRICNAGIMAAPAGQFFRWLSMLKNDNAQREYYLTDVPNFAKRDGVRCGVVECAEAVAMGVNSRAELARAEKLMQARLRDESLHAGVGMRDPDSVFLSYDTVLESDVQIEPFVVFGPGVTARSGARIRAFSHLEGAEVGRNAIVGPHARLRPGAVIEDEAHIGNFVEVKNSRVGRGAKANHLAYLGDATVGAGANIGAGTITCNYDGFDKHETTIGAGAFIGSNTALVAPVTVGAGAFIGAGSTIANDVAPDALAVVRAEQVEKSGWAEKFRTRKKADRAAKRSK